MVGLCARQCVEELSIEAASTQEGGSGCVQVLGLPGHGKRH